MAIYSINGEINHIKRGVQVTNSIPAIGDGLPEDATLHSLRLCGELNVNKITSKRWVPVANVNPRRTIGGF